MVPITHITVVSASAKTTMAAIATLLKNPSIHVRGIYRDLTKVPQTFGCNPNFTAVTGTVENAATLHLEEKCDAVVTMTPPLYGPPPEDGTVGFADRVANNLKKAVQEKGVGRLVLLSSWGAQLSEGTGEILTNHAAEVALADAAPEVIYARATAFLENWAMEMGTLNGDRPFFTSVTTPLEFKSPTVAVADIGRGLASLASSPEASVVSPRAVLLEGPAEYSPNDVQAAFEATLGTPVELRAIEPEGIVEYYTEIAHFPLDMAKGIAEMTTSMMRGGKIYEAWLAGRGRDEVIVGTVTLLEAIKALFHQQ